MKRIAVLLLIAVSILLTLALPRVTAQEWTFNSSPLTTTDVPLTIAPPWPRTITNWSQNWSLESLTRDDFYGKIDSVR